MTWNISDRDRKGLREEKVWPHVAEAHRVGACERPESGFVEGASQKARGGQDPGLITFAAHPCGS